MASMTSHTRVGMRVGRRMGLLDVPGLACRPCNMYQRWVVQSPTYLIPQLLLPSLVHSPWPRHTCPQAVKPLNQVSRRCLLATSLLAAPPETGRTRRGQSGRSMPDVISSTQSLSLQTQRWNLTHLLARPKAPNTILRIASGAALPARRLRQSCSCWEQKPSGLLMWSCASATGGASSTTPGQPATSPCGVSASVPCVRAVAHAACLSTLHVHAVIDNFGAPIPQEACCDVLVACLSHS